MGDFEAACTLPFSEPQSFYVLCPEKGRPVFLSEAWSHTPTQASPPCRGRGGHRQSCSSEDRAWGHGFGECKLEPQSRGSPAHAAVGAPWDPLGPLDPGTESQQASCPFVPGSLCKHTRSSPVASQTPWGSELWS